MFIILPFHRHVNIHILHKETNVNPVQGFQFNHLAPLMWRGRKGLSPIERESIPNDTIAETGRQRLITVVALFLVSTKRQYLRSASCVTVLTSLSKKQINYFK